MRRSRLGSHQVNCLRCHVQAPGSWPAEGEQLQPITSCSEKPWLDQGCPLCSRRDEVNAKVPSILGMLTHWLPHHHHGRSPAQCLPGTARLPFMLPIPRGLWNRSLGWEGEAKGKRRDLLVFSGCLFSHPLLLRIGVGEGREVLDLS